MIKNTLAERAVVQDTLSEAFLVGLSVQDSAFIFIDTVSSELYHLKSSEYAEFVNTTKIASYVEPTDSEYYTLLEKFYKIYNSGGTLAVLTSLTPMVKAEVYTVNKSGLGKGEIAPSEYNLMSEQGCILAVNPTLILK